MIIYDRVSVRSHRLVKSGTGLYSLPSFLPPPIDLSAVTNRMNHERLFRVKNLIEDAVIAYAELIESGEFTRQGLGANGIQVRGQPPNALDDPTAKRFI
jgi:hypothetical protein